MKLKIKDKVVVIAGKDKGKEGVVERVYRKSLKVLVKGVNKFKKHVKKSEAFPQGGLVEVERPLPVSNVMFLCPHCKKRTRLGYSIEEQGAKKRICRSCKKTV